MMKAVRVLATLCVALLGWPGASLAQVGVAVGAGTAWPGPLYGPYPSYPYGAYAYPYGGFAPWWPCMYGPCVDDIQVRRAVRRELQLQELRRELELREGAGFAPGAGSPYGIARPAPPPTPESHVQPRYRGSGEVRPEYRDTGQQR